MFLSSARGSFTKGVPLPSAVPSLTRVLWSSLTTSKMEGMQGNVQVPGVAPQSLEKTAHRENKQENGVTSTSCQMAQSTSERATNVLHNTGRSDAEDRLRISVETSEQAEDKTTSVPMPITKKRGYNFFRAIGSPKYIVAPMVDHSELAYRILCRQYGADLCFTQMFNSETLQHNQEFKANYFDFNKEKDRPLIVQLAGNKPQLLLSAAKMVASDCDAVDLNLGCPQNIARRGHYGSFLLEEKELLYEIVSTLDQNLPLTPVTCKIRLLDSVDATIELCKVLEQAGASMITVHGRTRKEKKAQNGSNWDAIRRIRDEIRSIPIIANGGIENLEDVRRCMEVTQADGVMSSEAVLENPAVFCDRVCPRTGKYMDQLAITKAYLEICKEHPPLLKLVRGHMFKFLYTILSRPSNHDLRPQLGKARSWEEIHRVFGVVEERETQRKAERANSKRRRLDAKPADSCNTVEGSTEKVGDYKRTDGNVQESKSVLAEEVVVSWYRRHRKDEPLQKKEPEPEKGADELPAARGDAQKVARPERIVHSATQTKRKIDGEEVAVAQTVAVASSS